MQKREGDYIRISTPQNRYNRDQRMQFFYGIACCLFFVAIIGFLIWLAR